MSILSHVRRNPYAIFLDKLEKPARYIGGEQFQLVKDWAKTQAKVALCFPDAYEIGMSHLGFKILYEELNKQADILAERVFAPWPDMEKELRERNLPLVSLENYRPLSHFDVLGFSLQYEMTYTNILNMLDLGGVTIWQNERKENEPFVICGGPCATHPEPLAPFMDFIVVGDGEDLFVRLSRFISQAKSEGKKRQEILLELAHWKGIYVPSLYNTTIDEKTELEVVTGSKITGLPERIERFFVENLINYPIPTQSPIPHLTAIFDRFSVELSRGCTEGCRFCQAGMIYRPVRERRPTDVVAAVVEGIRKGGFDEASLTCLSTADYSAVTPLVLELLDKVKEEGATLGISSLRAYGLDPRVLDKMAEVKNSALTFAPEAGTERMRKVINKNITEEDMMKTAREVFSRGWKKMKLYFMIGLPTETDEDVIGIMETGKKAREEAIKVGVKKPEITVSASSFVPKPHTPFQWSSMITLSEIERKQHMLWELSKKYKLNFRKHLSKTSFMEGVIARGDRRIGNVIYLAWQKGARFDGWDETFKYDIWVNSLEELNVQVANYLGTIRMDGKLPWSHIDVGLEDKFLEREWKKAAADRSSPPCGKPMGAHVHHTNVEALDRDHIEQKKRLVCFHCGVKCDLQGMVDERREFLTSLKALKDNPYEPPKVLKKNIAALREKRNQNIGFKYRIEFSKLGPISFISHLDLQKVVSRIFKRAGIQVLHSEGFKSRPLISFGPALGLGTNSLSEFFDVRVPEEWKVPGAILDLLKRHSERGLLFKTITPIGKNAQSIQDGAKNFMYFLPLENDLTQNLEEAIEKVLKEPEIKVQSFSKKDQKFVEKDIRPFIAGIKRSSLSLAAEAMDLIDEVQDCKQKEGILVMTNVKNGTGIRPSELYEFFHSQGLPVQRPIKTAVII